MSHIQKILLLPCLLMLSFLVNAQDTTHAKISSRYITELNKQASSVESKLDKKTAKALQRLQKQEEQIRRKVAKLDSSKAKELLTSTKESYARLQQRLSKTGGKLKQYIPGLDSMGTSLQFLQDNPEWLGDIKGIKEKTTAALGKVKGLQQQFQKAEDVKDFLQQRKQYLKEQLQNLGLAKHLKKINKEVYYYSAQVNEYKELLKDHKKATRKALQLLSKTKPFQNFMRKHSQLAGLFRIPDPDNPATAASLAGLQTRAQVNNLIQNQLAAGGPGAQAQFSQNLQDAQGQLNQLKDKFLKGLGGGSTDMAMPEGFKPNGQKTKSFWKRIELGTNFQSQRRTGLLPVTSDIGLSIGYKLNDKSVIGIGASYKLGWGESIRKIRISHQGMGLRTFVDWKAPFGSSRGGITGGLWVTGGYEWNYRPALEGLVISSPFGGGEVGAWQQSGLIGISKVIAFSSPIGRKRKGATKMQVLWDILSYRQVPRTPAIVFRVGYGL